MILDLLITWACIGTAALGIDTYLFLPKRKAQKRWETQRRIKQLERQLGYADVWIKRPDGKLIRKRPRSLNDLMREAWAPGQIRHRQRRHGHGVPHRRRGYARLLLPPVPGLRSRRRRQATRPPHAAEDALALQDPLKSPAPLHARTVVNAYCN